MLRVAVDGSIEPELLCTGEPFKCLWEVFVWVFGVLFLSCACVSVLGVLFSVGVCVCV